MTEKQQEEIDLLKELIADSSIANDEREIYQKALTTLLSQSGSEEPKVAKKMMPKKEKATPKTKATKKPKATKPAQLPSDVEAMKKQIKERTGKTEAECEDIISQYRMLRNKAKVNGAKRIAKLKGSDDLIAGTNVITPVAQIEKDAEIVKAKIEKQVEQIENKAEREVVKKDKTKDEVKIAVEKKVVKELAKLSDDMLSKSTTFVKNIQTELKKVDKTEAKNFLLGLRNEIDALLSKFGDGGTTQIYNIAEMNSSSSSVNPSKFARGGGVNANNNDVRVKALIKSLDNTPNSIGLAILRERLLTYTLNDLEVMKENPIAFGNFFISAEMYKDYFNRVFEELKFEYENGGEVGEFANGGGLDNLLEQNIINKIQYYPKGIPPMNHKYGVRYKGKTYTSNDTDDLVQKVLLETNKMAMGGEVGDKLELFYVMDNNGNVKNISKSYEKANDFLEKSLKFNGKIGHKNVLKSDWDSEKINTSNIKKYDNGGGVDKLPSNLQNRLNTVNRILVNSFGRKLTTQEAIRWNIDNNSESGFNAGQKAIYLVDGDESQLYHKDYYIIGDALIDISTKMTGVTYDLYDFEIEKYLQGKGDKQTESQKETALKYSQNNKFADGGLIGNQKRIDLNENGKIDAEDFKLLRSTRNGAWRKEHKYVNSTSRNKKGKLDKSEVRYAKKNNPSRTGYNGKTNYAMGGGIEDSPSIYVADLEAYNNGRLNGEWLKLTDYNNADELMEAIQVLLDKWGVEEYAIHDTEYIPSNLSSEYMGQRDFEQLYEMIDLANEYNLPLEVVQDVVSQYDASAVEEYQGKYDNAIDFAEQLVDETGIESFIDFQQYLDISNTDRRLLANEFADSYVDDIKNEDGGNRVIEEAGLDVSEYEEADSNRQDEMLDEAVEIVREEYYNTWYDGLDDPYYFLVEEQGLFSADDFAKADFVRIDYDKLADALEQDYTFIYDSNNDLYVFNIR